MANKREAKKNIDYMTYSVVHDCMLHLEASPNNNRDEVLKIISDILHLRNDLFYKVNHTPKSKKSEVRSYYREIYKGLLEGTNQAFNALSTLIQKK